MFATKVVTTISSGCFTIIASAICLACSDSSLPFQEVIPSRHVLSKCSKVYFKLSIVNIP
jgi:hypothetical protein